MYTKCMNDTPTPSNNEMKLGLFADDIDYWIYARFTRSTILVTYKG